MKKQELLTVGVFVLGMPGNTLPGLKKDTKMSQPFMPLMLEMSDIGLPEALKNVK